MIPVRLLLVELSQLYEGSSSENTEIGVLRYYKSWVELPLANDMASEVILYIIYIWLSAWKQDKGGSK